MEKEIRVWKPIEFSIKWYDTDTSKFDDLVKSWQIKRKDIQDNPKEYEEFINRLKRQHAIETGIIEKLYDVSEGVTETLIKEGFIASYISHNDTNIPPEKLMGFLSDHYEAINFIFDLINSNRQLSISFIKELHQLITRNQASTIAIDPQNNIIEIELLKGEFKKANNNPRRADGTLYFYCPPVQVDSEMDRLIEIYEDLIKMEISPIVISAWLHHAFTQIHPFQDGNGRIARLLASLVLIKNNLFPLVVKRNEKAEYIKVLEDADNENPNPIVMFFSNIQKRNIEAVLNFKEQVSTSDIVNVANTFATRVHNLKTSKEKKRIEGLETNRNKIFDCIYTLLGEIKNELIKIITIDQAEIRITSVKPEEENYYWYSKQIADFASSHNYYFNKLLPRGWFKLSFLIDKAKRYDLIITLHHFSYEDSVVAIGSFLEFTNENIIEGVHTDKTTTIPIKIAPYTISLESYSEKLHKNIEEYLRDIIKIGLTIITNEII